MQVPVFIIAHDAVSTQTRQLQELLSDELFAINIVTPPAGQRDNLQSQERWLVKTALTESATRFPDAHTLIVKENSVTTNSGEEMASYIAALVSDERSRSWDICYLCKWMDACEQYTDKRALPGSMMMVVRTPSPHGVQALLVSPQGRDFLLGKKTMSNGKKFNIEQASELDEALNRAISEGALKSTTTTPNLFHVAPGDADHRKYQACRDPAARRAALEGALSAPRVSTPPARRSSAEHDATAQVLQAAVGGGGTAAGILEGNNWWIWGIVVFVIVVVVLLALFYWIRNRRTPQYD